MNLEFETLEIINFHSFVKQTIDLRDYLTGLHFLRGINEYEPRLGPNGAGKSSLFAALTWCLYGKTVNGLRNPDVKPWSGAKPTEVTLWYKADKKPHFITRSTDPNRLLRDDDPIGQDEIDKLIGFDLFRHTILLGQGQDLFYDLKPTDKMKMFAEALPLEKWSLRAKAASDRCVDLSNKLSGVITKEAGVTGSITQLEELIAKNKVDETTWEADKNKNLDEGKAAIKAGEKKMAEFQAKVDDATLVKDGAWTELAALEKEIAKQRISVDNANNVRIKIKLDISYLERDYQSLENELAKLTSSDRCPTCGQKVKSKVDIKKHGDELETKMADTHTTLNKQRKLLKDKEKEQKELETVLSRLQPTADKFKKDLDAAESAIGTFSPMLTAAKVHLGSLKTALKVLVEGDNPYSEQVRGLQKRLRGLQREGEQLDEDHKLLSRKLTRTQFWIKGFKEVQLYIIEEILQELELVTNAMLPDIGLDDWEVHYAVEKETQAETIQRGLNITIQSPANKKPVKWESFSGGEKQRLRIVGALALSDVLLNHAGISCNLEILDEPSSHMSREGVRDLCPFLALRAKQQGKKIFLVDHVGVPSSHFQSITTVVKTAKNVSMIRT